MDLHNSTGLLGIEGIPPLSNTLLLTELSRGITLGEFLKSTCSIVSDGIIKVYATTDTSFFNCLEENRNINELHVQSLMDSFTKDGYLFSIIYVNERMELIDGQHRFEAAKRKGLPIYFHDHAHMGH